MVHVLIDARDDGDRVAAHARRLLREQVSKSKAPMGVVASRAMVPEWCATCDERCWGIEGSMFNQCPRCRGEGKRPLGFGF